MSGTNDYNGHTFLSRVLGNSVNTSSHNTREKTKDNTYGTMYGNVFGNSNGKRSEGESSSPPFLNDDATESQFLNAHPYMDNYDEKVKDMLMSEVSLQSHTTSDTNRKDKKKKKNARSNISINFNSESEDSSNSDLSEDDGPGDDKSNQSTQSIRTDTPNLAHDNPALSNSEKNKIRKELESELELELDLDNDFVPESLILEEDNRYFQKKDTTLLNKLESSVIYQVKEVEKVLAPKLSSLGERAKKIASRTIEQSVLQQPTPTFLSRADVRTQTQANLSKTKRQLFRARKLPPKERALWMWSNITNLDIFLHDVYDYYIGNGWTCIALSKTCDLLIIVFVISLTAFMGNCIDYSILFNENVNSFSQVYDGACYSKISFSQKSFFATLILILLLRIKNCYKEMLELREIQIFYKHLLNIGDSELQTISWPQIVKKIMILKNQNTNALITENDNDLKSKLKLNAHDIANRLMRKDNYMIAIFNKKLLTKALKMPIISTQYLTKTLEWNLKLCIFDFLFNEEGQLKKKVLSQHHRLFLIKNLRKRFRVAGLLSIFLTPFLVIYFLLYYFLKLFYDFKTNPGLLNARTYSPYAKWKMREYNELPHLFDQRINCSIEFADNYLNQFPKEISNIILKFVSFVSGSLVTILAILTIIDPENFLNFELTEGKTALFYMSIFGAIFTICKNSISDSNSKYLFDPETSLKNVSKFTHYLPISWDNRYHTIEVKNQFCDLYNLKLYLIFQELCSLIFLPYILYFSLPKSSDKIIDFFRDFTIHVDGIGYVCSFATFTSEKDKDNVEPDGGFKAYTENDDKMMQSYLYFLESYSGNKASHRVDDKDSGKQISFMDPTKTLLKRNLNQNDLLKSAVLNSRKNVGNGGISNMNKSPTVYQEQMEDTVAGLPTSFSPNATRYVNHLSNSMMLGESYQLASQKGNSAYNVSISGSISGSGSGSGGVLGLLNQVYRHK